MRAAEKHKGSSDPFILIFIVESVEFYGDQSSEKYNLAKRPQHKFKRRFKKGTSESFS